MFYMRLLSVVKNKLLSSNKFSTSSITFLPRNFVNNTEHDIKPTGKKFDKEKTCSVNEVDTLSEIEANLFANSENSYKPATKSTKDLLKEFKKTNDSRTFTPKNIELTQKQTFPKKTESGHKSREIDDTELGITYTRLDLNHPTLSKLLMSVKSRKHRDKNHLILIEGRRLILEALECGLPMETIIFSQKEQIALIKDKLTKISKNGGIYKVPQHDLKIWSALTTPPGLIGIFIRPNAEQENMRLDKLMKKSMSVPVTIICDNIREPNNLGSIIRTAAAVPCSEIVLLKGCCDPWELKALRGGCGGQFRVRIKDNANCENIIKIFSDSNFIVAENNLQKLNSMKDNFNVEIYSDLEILKNSHNVVIIGGETHGISEETYNLLKTYDVKRTCIHVPLANGIESLNTASALTLILFELRRKYLNTLKVVEEEEIIEDKC